MIALRLHKGLYRGTVVDEAAKLFTPFVATLELIEEPAHWVVRVAAETPARTRQVAGELANWALGKSVQLRHTPQTDLTPALPDGAA